jgi:predicted phosphoribosyltransferase
MERYQNRRDAGQRLARHLAAYAHRPNTLVLGLPRGGVPVGAEVAASLGCPLDVLIVRKLGVPGYPEYAMGAIAEGNVTITHDEVIRDLRIPATAVADAVARERTELTRRELTYRGTRTRATIANQTVIVVDDGLATGATMEAAVTALRRLGAARIVVAAPVGSAETCARLRATADDVVCPLTPSPFSAVGAWYDDFSQTTDEEVERLLASGR